MRRALGCLVMVLAAALVSNVWLADQLFDRWVAEKELRLDPLGLRAYPGHAQGAEAGETRLVVFGDSRASAWTPDVSRHGLEVVNRGVGGETTAQAVERFEHHVAPHDPSVVLIQVGVNDLVLVGVLPKRRVEIVESCRRNIERIVRKARDSGATVVLTTVFPIGDIPLTRRPFSSGVSTAIDEVNEYLRSLRGDGVIVIDAATLLADSRGRLRQGFASDWLHLNSAGYRVLDAKLNTILESLDPEG